MCLYQITVIVIIIEQFIYQLVVLFTVTERRFYHRAGVCEHQSEIQPVAEVIILSRGIDKIVVFKAAVFFSRVFCRIF